MQQEIMIAADQPIPMSRFLQLMPSIDDDLYRVAGFATRTNIDFCSHPGQIISYEWQELQEAG